MKGTKPSRRAIVAWVSSLVAAVVAGLIVAIVEDWGPSLLTERVKGSGVSAARWTTEPITLARWVVVAAALAGMALVAIVAIMWLRSRRTAPWREQYRKDDFLGIRWEWDYDGNNIDGRTISPFCPKCDYRLLLHEDGAYRAVPHIGVTCEECGFSWGYDGTTDQLQFRVGRLIERSINTGAWRKQVMRSATASRAND